MKGLREMTKEEIKAIDGKMVVEIYSNFQEKVNGHASEYDGKPFPLYAVSSYKYYTDDDGLYISKSEHYKNTYLDFILKGYREEEARKLATNDKVTVTSIFKEA